MRLREAIELGDEAAIDRAIASGVDLEEPDSDDELTAVFVAAYAGHIAILDKLLAAGARREVDAPEPFVKYYLGSNARRELLGKWTLLHSAALGGSDEMLAHLIDHHGLTVDARDHGGKTALHIAAFYPLGTTNTLDVLLARGADPNAEDALGQNPLCGARNLAYVERLLAAGAHHDGGSHVAPVVEQAQSVILGRVMLARAHNPRRPLEKWALERDPETVTLLLDWGAMITVEALHSAEYTQSPLLDRMVDAASEDVLAVAVESFSDEALFERVSGRLSRATPGLLFAAVAMQSVARAKLVLAKSADLGWRDGTGKTALHLAAERSDLAMVQLLREASADPNAADHENQTPLHVAAERSARAIVEALLDGGAQPNAADHKGQTPLHRAAQTGNLALVTALVARGADPNVRDGKGKTPRSLAFGQGDDEGVRRFLEPLTHLPPPPPPAQPKGLAAGARVTHVKFGGGTVVKVTGDKATVKFDGDAGEKTLLARVLAPT